ncbi:MAG: hypothetical protein RLN69_03830 [Woeseiaceae bacterium]
MPICEYPRPVEGVKATGSSGSGQSDSNEGQADYDLVIACL